MSKASEKGIIIKNNTWECAGCGRLMINHELEDKLTCANCGNVTEATEKNRYKDM